MVSKIAFFLGGFRAVCGADFVFMVVMSGSFILAGFCRARGFIKFAKELQAFWKNFGATKRIGRALM